MRDYGVGEKGHWISYNGALFHFIYLMSSYTAKAAFDPAGPDNALCQAYVQRIERSPR